MDEKKEEEYWKEHASSVPWWTSTRLGVAAIAFFGFLLLYAQRVGMSVAIVCMVNQTAVTGLSDVRNNDQSTKANSTSNLCEVKTAANSEGSGYEDGPFIWDKPTQGQLLASFFYGYLVSQVPAGMLAESYSAKWVFFIFMSVSTAATLLTPLLALVSWQALMALRIVAGIGSGGCYPSMMAVWSKWAPPTERSKLANLTFAGAWMGNVVAMPLSGLLCRYGFAGGWPSIFYVIGGISVLWLCIWAYFVSDTPKEHKRIKDIERDYIIYTLKDLDTSSKKRRETRTPWMSILTSRCVWAVVVAGICIDWGLYTFLTNMPIYMYEVLNFDVEANGFLSALPFIGLYINMNISPFIADKLYASGTWRLVSVRKLMYTVGSLGAAAFMIALAFVDCRNPELAVAFLFLGITISASVYSGYMVNPIDIAPQYAGTVLGLVNGLAAATGFAAPQTVAALTPNRSPQEWQYVFYLSAGIYVFGTVVFGLFGSAEVQPWAKDTDNDNVDTNGQELKVLNGKSGNIENGTVKPESKAFLSNAEDW